ncbi:ABC transporter permease [Microbacterium excoecariae]|uniref:ABC transporter permease n=1 Tax=Microbacterium excoecariae TaxID=2715210 RepID=UPI00140E0C27|nr:ABC transporter permease [Microbacterium excoecariae]NHI17689.1 ABC transporter permease [Microbacterium excoecariae]
MTASAVAPASRTLRIRAPREALTWLALLPGILLALLAIVGPFVVPFDPEAVVGPPSSAPDATYWFGTDSAGMDVFSRTIAAAQVDLFIGLATTVIATTGGILLGMFSGMGESRRGVVGLVARGTSRVLDLADAVPLIVIAMVAVALFGATPLTMIVVLAIILAPSPARLTRAETLRVRREAYLDAARIHGMTETRLSLRHVLLNAAAPAIENMSVIFGLSIAVAAALGFLGVGIAPPTPEWGAMVSRGTSDLISGRWWSSVFPAAMLGAAIVSAAAAGAVVLARIRR